MTASCDNSDLARVIWFISHTRPNIKVAWLRAKTYVIAIAIAIAVTIAIALAIAIEPMAAVRQLPSGG